MGEQYWRLPAEISLQALQVARPLAGSAVKRVDKNKWLLSSEDSLIKATFKVDSSSP